ncbi:hypothetical protein BSKO_04194 [Bryopsis sp. KO-2023]|nr:hypothetical protein BSKO_04194 [Bryopsis sp. KO-2023]
MTADVKWWRWAFARHIAYSDRPLLRHEGVRGLLDLEEDVANETTWLMVPDEKDQASCENTNEFWKDGAFLTPPAPKPAARVPLSNRAPIEAPIVVTPMPESKEKLKLPKSLLKKRVDQKMTDSGIAAFTCRSGRSEERRTCSSVKDVVDFREFCKKEETEDPEEDNPFCWLLETPEFPVGFKRINGSLLFKDCLGENDHCLSARNPRKLPLKTK